MPVSLPIPWEIFKTDSRLKETLRGKLANEKEMISFAESPLLASLLASMGLQFEIGRADFDRFSELLGVPVTTEAHGHWESELIKYKGRVGVRFFNKKIKEFAPNTKGLVHFFHPFSISQSNLFNQVMIFPEMVAEKYKSRGIELVIVKDWALSTFLSPVETEAVNYLKANSWEIKNNSGLLQAKLMHSKRLSFSGTHDMVDHLLNGDAAGLSKNDDDVAAIMRAFNQLFSDPQTTRNSDLVISYFLGVLLDDLAQPRWYGSPHHSYLVHKCLDGFLQIAALADMAEPEMPKAFTAMMKLVREQAADFHPRADKLFNEFLNEMKARMEPSLVSAESMVTA